MTTLNFVDIKASRALDCKALAAIKGGAEWHQRSATIYTGNWGAYSRFSQAYQGVLFHDGYLSRHYVEGWQRQRTQTEVSYWDHYVRV